MTITWKELAYRADVLPDLLSPYAVGDLIYAGSTTTLAKLTAGAVGAYLRGGGAATPPLWSTLILPNAATAFRLPVATAANTIGELTAVGATGEYLKGNTGAIPSWATLNQAAVAGLTTADGPTFAHLHLSDVAAITTAAESWIGPSSTAGIYFKGGNVGIGIVTPLVVLEVAGDVMQPANAFIASNIYWGGAGWNYRGNGPAGLMKMADTYWGGYVFATAPVNSSGAAAAATLSNVMYIIGTSVGIGATSFGTSAANVLGIGSGTAPSSFPADMAQMCVKDQAAGNACFHFYTELGQIIKLYQQVHVANPTDLATCITAITAILTRMENLGFNATA